MMFKKLLSKFQRLMVENKIDTISMGRAVPPLKLQLATINDCAWSDDLLTGDEIIDFQHKKLFDYLNILNATAQSKQPRTITLKNTIDSLIEFTNLHFDDEEIVLENMGYPELLEHKEMHRTFREKAMDFKQRFDRNEDILADLILFIQDHLVIHVRQEDMKAFKYKT